ncbi:MAG TPA: hypothetical protein VHT91_19660 [Kofleriaceae bacterium]|jgi:hypothetical protein|nr:hypothetical protein [Kofleriaceae bacterium]
MSLDAVRAHADSRKLELPRHAKLLCRELRNMLIAASDAGTLSTSHNEVYGLVRVLREPPPVVAEQLRARSIAGNACCVVGGEKNQDREHVVAHLKRNDDAWFDFTITVREHARELELLAYNFEIRFPSAMGTPFLRFDYNLPGHENELRSHLHAGSDDVYMPAPMMSPAELITLFTEHLRRPANREKWRDPTPFEIEWFRTTHEELAARGSRAHDL